jgi:hypothetical protein
MLLLLVVFLSTEHFRGKWALNRRLRALRANGEQLSIPALEPKRPNADRNAFLDLVALTNQLESIMTNLCDLPPSLRFGAPGKVVVAWRLNGWSSDGKATNDWTQIGQKLENAHGLLNLILAAAEKPEYDTGFDYRKGFVVFSPPPLAPIKQAVMVLNVAVLYELSQGRLGEAQQYLCAFVRLAAEQREPLVICQLVRHACAAIAFNATWEALQAQGWNDSQLASLQAAWEGCDFESDMASAFEMERAMKIDFFNQIKTSKDKLAFAVAQCEQVSDFSQTHGFDLYWAYGPLWRVAWIDQDELRALNCWQYYIGRDRTVQSNSWAVLAEHFTNGPPLEDFPWMGVDGGKGGPGWYHRLRYLFSDDTHSTPDYLIRKTLDAQVQQQMAITAIALARYKLRTGTLPSGLNALVPDFLKQLPRDRMDGKTLRYRLLPGGGYVLYSVGENGKEDGGDPALRPGKAYYSRIWEGRDAVWPTAATPDEAAAAMKPAKR